MQTMRVVPVGEIALVFGLEWVPLLGDSDPAPAMARRRGASHQALSGSPPAALGLAWGLPRRPSCWSAAAVLARQHPTGTVAQLVPFGDGSWHVLACHEGVALARADRSYPDHALARQAVDALRLSHPQVELLDDPDGVAVAGGQPPEALQDLARAATSVAPLTPVRRFGRRLIWSAGLALGVSGWLVSSRIMDGPPRPSPLSDRQAWVQALDQALARRPVHSAAGTRALLESLYRQPARLAGWALQSIRCEPGPAARWQCRGEYRRTHRDADNQGLLRAAPPDWHPEFPSLDQARVRWLVDVPAQAPEVNHLPAGALLAREWASALQGVLPAFSRIHLEPPKPLTPAAPVDAQGRSIPLPGDVPRVATRQLKIQGPLQSAALLPELAGTVSWHRVVLNFAPAARAGLRASRLTLLLEGTVYERT